MYPVSLKKNNTF